MRALTCAFLTLGLVVMTCAGCGPEAKSTKSPGSKLGKMQPIGEESTPVTEAVSPATTDTAVPSEEKKPATEEKVSEEKKPAIEEKPAEEKKPATEEKKPAEEKKATDEKKPEEKKPEVNKSEEK